MAVSFFVALFMGATSNLSHARDTYTHLPAFDMKRCVNMGNKLDTPRGHDWGPALDIGDFSQLRALGFDTIRLPVKFDDYTGRGPDYRLEAPFLDQVREAVDTALAEDLNVILDLHHFTNIHLDPDGATPKLVAIWEQLAIAFQDYPDDLWFEVLNEPQHRLQGEFLIRAQTDTLAAIRQHQPDRIVILGGENWSDRYSLLTNIPAPDENIVYTVHYYDPFNFTHQAAEFMRDDAPPAGYIWGSKEQRNTLKKDYRQFIKARARLNRPVFLGEFGVVGRPDPDHEFDWIQSVREISDQKQIPWCIWHYAHLFENDDELAGVWDTDMLAALGLPHGSETLASLVVRGQDNEDSD